ncbi:MAG: phosphoribosylamine--glycine ligase [Patescibacteria group bacterium]|nr:phosphoribosylamine--glycine ligase [Patescibacteria group bacterium]
MNILLVGGGGREHALAWKMRQSPLSKKLYIAPGNAGTATLGTNVELDTKNNDAVVEFAKHHHIGLVVIATDDYLAQGMVDALSEANIKAFGPTKAAAKLEWSKAFAKDFMKRHGIPTASSQTFTELDRALLYSENHSLPLVIKADGLALGKGVVIAESHQEAEETLREFMSGAAFGASGRTVVIEEFMEGKEVSVHAFSDGKTVKLFPTSRDHKRIGDGNTGPNTGGMGTIAPVPGLPDDFLETVRETIVMPTIEGMMEEGNPFSGILYPGLMLTAEGPKVVEFNARFGDPECESYMRLLESDLISIMLACVNGTLAEEPVVWQDNAATTVMLASGGYPGKYEKGFPITGIESAEEDPAVVVFHAGTAEKEGELITAGGRVLGVSAVGSTVKEARAAAYAAAAKIAFNGKQFRSDIGAS